MNTWSDAIVSRLQRLSYEGYSGSAIADLVNREFATTFTRNAVIGKLHRMGCRVGGVGAPVPVNWTEAMEAALTKAFAEGCTPNACASRVSAVAGRPLTTQAIYAKASKMCMSFRENERHVLVRRFFSGPRPMTPAEKAPRPVLVKRDVAPLAPEPELMCEPVALEALRWHHCRWPIGEPGTEGFGFCGLTKARGSYCAHHARVAYLPKPKRVAKADLPVYRTDKTFARFA
jgi:GcrA cell cycle regulator